MNTDELIDFYCDDSERGREIADDIAAAYAEGYEQGKHDAVVRSEWVYRGVYKIGMHDYTCGACGHLIRGSQNITNYYPFCNKCGAQMGADYFREPAKMTGGEERKG